MSELNTTGVPLPFEIEMCWEVYNVHSCEKYIHNLLDKCRINQKRELFSIDIKAAKSIIDAVVKVFEEIEREVNIDYVTSKFKEM
jgi:hypothetical protein